MLFHCRSVWDSFKDARMQLIIPLSIFIGLEQGFMYADFSKVRVDPGSKLGFGDREIVFTKFPACPVRSGTWFARWVCTMCASSS